MWLYKSTSSDILPFLGMSIVYLLIFSSLLLFFVVACPSALVYISIPIFILWLLKKFDNYTEKVCLEMYKNSKIANGCSYAYYKENLFSIDMSAHRDLYEKTNK